MDIVVELVYFFGGFSYYLINGKIPSYYCLNLNNLRLIQHIKCLTTKSLFSVDNK